jgi:molecular chaperone GrpE
MASSKKIVVEDEVQETSTDSVETPPDSEVAEDDGQLRDAVPQEEELEAALRDAKAEAEAQHDRMLRMAAELENFKKRSARELEEMKKFATENLIRQLLTVVDNLERAIDSAASENGNHQSVVDGVGLTLQEVMKILEKHHVSPINALGEPFDPSFHQAMSQEESDAHPPNTVIREFQKGYLIHDRLLRPAMVVVSKAAPTKQADDESTDTND